MRILADGRLPHLTALFEPLGSLQRHDGSPTREQLAAADVLLVRSVTRVGPALLEGTPVRFVGSATAGTDHLDLAGLRAVGIEVASAPGSNAPAVAEYVVCALVALGAVPGQTLGVVGCGQVGGRVVRHAAALGLEVLRSDPPLGLDTPLEQVLACDWVTLHVPLDETTRALAPRVDGGLLNTCRGDVLAPGAEDSSPLVLDVYAPEPPPPELVARADLATPHVAGHSLDGRAAMVRMVYEALSAWLGRAPDHATLVPPPPDPLIRTPPGAPDLGAALRQVYDLVGESARFKASGGDWRLRHDRPPRWELPHYRLERETDWPAEVVSTLRALGLR